MNIYELPRHNFCVLKKRVPFVIQRFRSRIDMVCETILIIICLGFFLMFFNLIKNKHPSLVFANYTINQFSIMNNSKSN